MEQELECACKGKVGCIHSMHACKQCVGPGPLVVKACGGRGHGGCVIMAQCCPDCNPGVFSKLNRCEYIDQHGHRCVNEVVGGCEASCEHRSDARKCSGQKLEWQVCKYCGTSHPHTPNHSDTPKYRQWIAEKNRKARLNKSAARMAATLENVAAKAQRIVDNHDDLKKPGPDLQLAAIEIRDACEAALNEARGE